MYPVRLDFCLSPHLHPYFVYGNREGSGEPGDFTGSPEVAARQCKSTKFFCAGSFVIMTYKSVQNKSNKEGLCAEQRKPDQATHPLSLIIVFAVNMEKP